MHHQFDSMNCGSSCNLIIVLIVEDISFRFPMEGMSKGIKSTSHNVTIVEVEICHSLF